MNMLYVGLFLTALLGFVCVNCISVKFTLIEKIGLSFPLGMALQVFLMLFIDQVGIPLKPAALLGGEALLLAGLCFFVYLYRKNAIETIRASVSLQSFKDVNLVWLFFILAIAYLEYMNFAKCLYFPPTDRDSLAGFETIGYIIAKEYTLKGLSIFDSAYMPSIHGSASYITYAPLVQLSYAYVYALGAETSKIIPGLMYLFFLLAFYGATSRAAGKTGAAIATFFMLLTPEMLAFSSLSMTNVIHALFASLSVIYMALWFRGKEKKDLLLCGMLLGGNILSRTEGIVFTGAALFLLFVDAFRTKQYMGFLQNALFALVPLVYWTVYTKINGLYAESIAITSPFWDQEKASTILTYMWKLYKDTMYYGLSFIAFLVALVANAWFLIRKRDNLYLLLAILLASLLYMLILYQIDYSWDTIENVLSFSAKRFMFCFIPLLWFFAFTNQATVYVVNKLDNFLIKR
jgi:hypothetical protein